MRHLSPPRVYVTVPLYAVAATGAPMSTPAAVFSTTLRVVLTDRSVKLRLAIGSVENLPVPRILSMVPCGVVARLSSENSPPSSVPASQGCRFTSCERSQRPWSSSSGSPETPTNQSGLGATMVTSVIRGCSVESVAVRVFEVVVPMKSVSPLRR